MTMLYIQVASGQDANVDISDPTSVGVIPAGTLLKTEFSAIIPDPAQAEKIQVCL